MRKFISGGLLVALWLNAAAAMYYLMFEVVPISVYWHAQIAGLKASWLVLPLWTAGAMMFLLIHNRFIKITSTFTFCGAAVYFGVLANIAMFGVLLQHTTLARLMLGISWGVCGFCRIPDRILKCGIPVKTKTFAIA